MNICIIIVCIFMFNNVILALYCLIQEKIDRVKRRNKESNNQDLKEDKSPNKLRILYRNINAYCYGWMRYNIILVGRIPSHRIRKFFYRYVYQMKLDKGTVIYGGSEFRSPWNIVIGRSTLAANCILDGRSGIVIGDNVVFGSGVHVWTEEHDLNDSFFRVLDHNKQPVIIEDRAWVCSDSTLLPGVYIEIGAVIASRACVTKRCYKYSVYAGIPAKKISDRNQELEYELTGKPTWHF